MTWRRAIEDMLLALALGLLLSVMFALPAHAALNATAVAYVREGGNDNNGVFFDTAETGLSFANQDGPQATLTTLSVIHTVTTQINVSVVDYTVTTNDPGNHLRITGGTATAGLYRITDVDVGNNRWTVDRAAGTAAQTVIGRMGGSAASPGRAFLDATVSGMKIWIKKHTTSYSISTFTAGNGGPLDFAAAGIFCGGYDVTPGDNTGNSPEILATMAAPGGLDYLVTGNGNNRQVIWNLRLDGASINNVGGVNMGNFRYGIFNCIAENFNGTSGVGFNCGSTYVNACYANTCITGFTGNLMKIRNCTAKACTTGFSVTQDTTLNNCLAYDCTADGFNFGGSASLFNCTAVDNTGDGFDASSFNVTLVDCLSAYNGGYGCNSTAVTTLLGLTRFYWVNSGTGRIPAGIPQFDLIGGTISADPFVNRAGDDYRLNSTAGAGLELRGVGFYPPTQTGNFDVGALQHADPAAGAAAAGNTVQAY